MCIRDSLSDIEVLGRGGQSGAHNARAGHADIDDAVRFARPMERAGHEGVILRRVAEHNEFRGRKAVVVGRDLGAAAHDASHQADRVEVDARLGRTDIDGRADMIGCLLYTSRCV